MASSSASQWQYTDNAIAGVRDIPNQKDTKRMKKELEKFDSAGAEEFNFYTASVQHVLLSYKNLKRLFELAKGSKTGTIDLHVETDKPLRADFYNDSDDHSKEERGEVILAPKILEDTDLKRSTFPDSEEQEETDGELKQRIQDIYEDYDNDDIDFVSVLTKIRNEVDA